MTEHLDTLNLKISYRSDHDDIIDDFYVPCMSHSVLYQRAVGYFTSHSLAYAASGVACLIQAGGRIQLVASPQLTHDDIAAIEEGIMAQEDVVERAAKRSFDEIKDLLVKERLEALAWMISTGCLEIKLAVRTSVDGLAKSGIYHEKIGIFSDNNKNSVAFIGSANETASGLIGNFEAIDVYCSWDDSQGRVYEKKRMFAGLWNDTTIGLNVIDFTEVTSEILKPYTPDYAPQPRLMHTAGEKLSDNQYGNNPDFPSWLALRDYQKQAIENWFNNNGKGSLKMATGSGKTITALSIVTHLYQKAGLKAAIVICPFKHLVDQWAAEAKKFNYLPLIVHTSRHIWADALNNKLLALNDTENRMLMVITTNASFAHEFFQSKLKHFPQKTIIVADEAHNLGAEGIRRKLPDSIPWRLALSATPERWFDEEGTEAIFKYFGNVLEPEFTLKDALDCGALSQYRYYPILVELSESEQDEYLILSEKIAKMCKFSDVDLDDPILKLIVLKRARLIATAENKLVELKTLMQEHKHSKHWLFYCGAGQVEDPSSEEEMRQIESVKRILGRELQMKVASFTAETPREKRLEISHKLDSGELQGLVAIRCLDEGVDIPSTQQAVILASSTNPRQFIQRRGRVLRKSDANPNKIADIYDMIVMPPTDAVVSEVERSLLRKEFIRFAEFASLAINAGSARSVIFGLQKKYDLMDI